MCYQLINHAYLPRSLTILFFLYTSRRVNCFSTPPITDATSGGGAKTCACFYGVWITNSRYTRNVFIKPGCFINISCIPYSFGLTHQEWREVRETAYSMDQNGDHIPLLSATWRLQTSNKGFSINNLHVLLCVHLYDRYPNPSQCQTTKVGIA